MVNYRRNRVKGGTYFFTVTLADRRATVLTDHIALLRDAFRTVQAKQPFEIEAIVVLPEHLHTVWILPPGNDDYPGRWKAIKSRFTRAVRKVSGLHGASSGLQANDRGEYKLWQRRYWEHTIQDKQELARHVAYIHFNPVKHGLVNKVADWPHSSFHRYVHRRRLDKDWNGNQGVREDGADYGE